MTEIFLDNAAEITHDPEMAKKIMELPHLVSYQFNHYRSVPVVNGMEEAAVVTSAAGMERLAREAAHVAESTMLARDLVNHPSMFMDPEQLAKECEALAEELGIEVQIYDKKQAEEMNMGAFLAVGRGSAAEPRLIVLRYKGGKEEEPPVALVGKGSCSIPAVQPEIQNGDHAWGYGRRSSSDRSDPCHRAGKASRKCNRSGCCMQKHDLR